VLSCGSGWLWCAVHGPGLRQVKAPARCSQPPAGAAFNIRTNALFALQLQLPDVVAMQTRQANLEGTGEIPLRRLVNELSECGQVASSSVRLRQAECVDLDEKQEPNFWIIPPATFAVDGRSNARARALIASRGYPDRRSTASTSSLSFHAWQAISRMRPESTADPLAGSPCRRPTHPLPERPAAPIFTTALRTTCSS
jgi:hypothetical protein